DSGQDEARETARHHDDVLALPVGELLVEGSGGCGDQHRTFCGVGVAHGKPPPRAIVPPMGVDVTLTGQRDANQAHTILHPGLTPAALGVTAATPPARATGPARAPWHDEARGAHPPTPFLLPCRLRPPARGVPTLRFRYRRCPGGPGRAGARRVEPGRAGGRAASQ